MLARIRKAQENEGGFTLIELLVVMIIIGILAAIAIPTFLKQRENGYKTAVKSDLKNAATDIESFATDNNGSYVGAALSSDFNASTNVTVTVDSATATAFCLEGSDSRLDAADIFHYSSADGEPLPGGC